MTIALFQFVNFALGTVICNHGWLVAISIENFTTDSNSDTESKLAPRHTTVMPPHTHQHNAQSNIYIPTIIIHMYLQKYSTVWYVLNILKSLSDIQGLKFLGDIKLRHSAWHTTPVSVRTFS